MLHDNICTNTSCKRLNSAVKQTWASTCQTNEGISAESFSSGKMWVEEERLKWNTDYGGKFKMGIFYLKEDSGEWQRVKEWWNKESYNEWIWICEQWK